PRVPSEPAPATRQLPPPARPFAGALRLLTLLVRLEVPFHRDGALWLAVASLWSVFLLDLFKRECHGLRASLVAVPAIVNRSADGFLQLDFQKVDGVLAALALRDEHFGQHLVVHTELEEDRRGLVDVLRHVEIVNARFSPAQSTAAGRYGMRCSERIGEDVDLFLVPIVGGLAFASIDLDPHAPCHSPVSLPRPGLPPSLDRLLRRPPPQLPSPKAASRRAVVIR